MPRFARLLLPGFALLGLVLAACLGSSSSESGRRGGALQATATVPPTCPDARPGTAGSSAVTMAEFDRQYLLHVPPLYDGAKAVPLVIAIHGFTMDAEYFAGYNGLTELADREGFILITPQGLGDPPGWTPAGAEDIDFLTALLDELTSSLCVDADRVYVAGYSNGGGMAQALACEAPSRIAAIALVAATYGSCREDVPLIAFHGIDDPIVPFEGGERPGETGIAFPNVRRSVGEWARNVGCDGLAVISRPSPGVELSTYKRCLRSDGEVLLYAIVGGGHTWPGAETPLDAVGATSREIDANANIWAFFKEHPLSTRTTADASR